MATTQEIKTKLTLDGVQAATSDLKKLGEEGANAFNKIQSAADKIGSGIGGKLDATIRGLKKSFADLGNATKDISNKFSAVQRSSLELGAAFGTVAGRIGIAAGAIAGATGAFFAFAKQAADNADNLSDVAEGLGLTTKAFQELAFAAQLSGLSQEDFAAGLSKLNIVLGDALSGSADAAKKFQELGVALRDANGNARPTEEILKDLADAIAKIPDAATRAAVGSNFFGKSIAKWLPLINSGRAGIEALQKQFAASGIGFSDKDIESAKAFNDALDVLFKSIQQLRDKVFLQFAAPFAKAFEQINQVIIDNADQIIAVANNLAAQIGPVFKDIVAALLGNDQNVKAQWVVELRDNFIAFGKSVSQVVNGVILPAFKALNAAGTGVAKVMNGIFGTSITGESIVLTATVLKLVGAFQLIGPVVGLASSAVKLFISLFRLIAPAIAAVTTVFPVIAAGAEGVIVALGALASWPVVIIAGIAATALAIYAFWDQIVAYTTGSWQYITEQTYAGAQLAAEAIVGAWNAIVEYLTGVWQTILQGAIEAWTAVANFIASAWNGVVEIISGVASSIVEIWSGVVDSIASVGDGIVNIWEGVVSAIENLWGNAVSFITSAAQSILSWINGVIQAIYAAIAAAGRLIGMGGGSPQQRAAGGYISGPGTGTSDSIPAMLSNGEYVIKAAAVRKYGTSIFSALNQMRLPRGAVPQFNVGGLVDGLKAGLVPGFAMGGLVAVAAPSGGGRPINVTIGNDTFAMSAPDDVADKLIKYASRRKVASAGRKPSWYGA